MFSVELVNISFSKLVLHFFSKLPIREIQWKKISSGLSPEVQIEIISKTVDSTIILRYPINIAYQKQFLKSFIDYLELQKAVIANCVYDAFGRLVSLPSNSAFSYAYYPIKKYDGSEKLPLIILKENVNIISEGTTGLRTWQASQALAEWVLQNPEYVDGKNILELGSGIGLTGLVVILSTSASKYILTDCHPSVLSVLCENVKLNTRENNEVRSGTLTGETLFSSFSDSSEVQVRKLAWEKTTENSCKSFGSIDSIFAADVVYDSDLFEPLLNTLIAFFKAGTKEAVFASTERNSDTLRSFWRACGSKGLTVDILRTPEPLFLTWQSDCPIFLSKIYPSPQ